jgi:hypothetical protein
MPTRDRLRRGSPVAARRGGRCPLWARRPVPTATNPGLPPSMCQPRACPNCSRTRIRPANSNRQRLYRRCPPPERLLHTKQSATVQSRQKARSPADPARIACCPRHRTPINRRGPRLKLDGGRLRQFAQNQACSAGSPVLSSAISGFTGLRPAKTGMLNAVWRTDCKSSALAAAVQPPKIRSFSPTRLHGVLRRRHQPRSSGRTPARVPSTLDPLRHFGSSPSTRECGWMVAGIFDEQESV